MFAFHGILPGMTPRAPQGLRPASAQVQPPRLPLASPMKPTPAHGPYGVMLEATHSRGQCAGSMAVTV